MLRTPVESAPPGRDARVAWTPFATGIADRGAAIAGSARRLELDLGIAAAGRSHERAAEAPTLAAACPVLASSAARATVGSPGQPGRD
jgi:hypothetical protein